MRMKTTEQNNSTKISIPELQAALDRGERYQLFDVRSAQEYAEGHIPCAINLPLEEVESRLADMRVSDPVVLICHSGDRAEMASCYVTPHRGDVSILEGGTAAWIEAGLGTVSTQKLRLPLMRQVQLVAGSLALTGSVLALTISPLWAVLSGFIGAGLTFAGASGWCGMALLLKRMPWNRSANAASSRATQPQSALK